MFNPREFYLLSLNAAGVTPPPDELQKVAEAEGVSLEQAKLAQAYFEQLQLDKIPYENEGARSKDALLMAKAYMDHVKEARLEAIKVADGLLRVLEHAAEGYLAHNNIGIDARTAVKIAGMQSESAQAYEADVAELAKTAAADKTANTLADVPMTPQPSWMERNLGAVDQGIGSAASSVDQAIGHGAKAVGNAAMTGVKGVAQFPGKYPNITGALGMGGLAYLAYKRQMAEREAAAQRQAAPAPAEVTQ